MGISNFFRTAVMRGRAAKYAACVVLACVAAVLTAVPIFGQTVTATLVGAGDIASCSYAEDEKTALLLDQIGGTVFTLGDNAYPDGTRAQFANCYDNYKLSDGSPYDSSRPSWWGKHKHRTMPTLGNHEYRNSTDPALQSKPYFDYFSAVNGFLEPAAPVPNEPKYPNQYGLTFGKGYYSYDLGSWHIVALNSNNECVNVSCASTSAQAEWLRNDLAAHPSQCTLAYWHHPLYASGTGSDIPEVHPFWQILYNQGADVIVAGHAHRYERFARIKPNPETLEDSYGIPDSVYGIRQFIVGTGGAPPGTQYGEDDPRSQVKLRDTRGVIKLDLSAGSYTWQFVAVDGTADGTVMDSSSDVYGPGGSEQCHDAPGNADTVAPTVSSVAPVDGATDVVLTANAEATFSEAMDNTAISGSTFALVKQGTTTAVAATVTYDSTTKTATLNPDADLEWGTTYTATVKGGANGVKDAAGNPLAADKVWSFTTAAAPPADTTPPETTIDSGPSGPTNSASASFAFSSNETSSTFECSLDNATYSSCTSPKDYTGLAEGSHTFEVRAIDAAGNTDGTSASRSWTVDTTAPEANSLAKGFVLNSTLGTSAIPVQLTWSATDGGGSGIAGYQLQQSTNGGAYQDVALSPVTTTTITPSLAPANTYQFQVRAQDQAGNWSAWQQGPNFRVDTYQESYSAIIYGGTWRTQSLSSAYGGALKYAKGVGTEKATFAFTGSEVAWVAPRNSNRGRADVYVDGTKVATVDLYAASEQSRQVVFSLAGLDPSVSHTLEVRVLGTKNAASSGKRVDVDALVVLR